MRLSNLLLPVILACTLASPALAKPNLPYCDFAEEEPSSIERVVGLSEVGITIKIPVNMRLVKKNDGNIELMDNGTYNLIQCMSRPNSGVAGRGAMTTNIKRVNPEYFYDYIVKEVPSKEGMYIAAKKSFNSSQGYSFELWLRIKTPKGVFDISNTVYGGLTTKEEIEEEVNDLVMTAQSITINP